VEAHGKIIDADDPLDTVTSSPFMRTFNGSVGGNRKGGQTMSTYRRPHFQGSIENPPRDADGKIPAESLSETLGRVSENSMGEIDNLVGEFQRLREKLREPTGDATDENHLRKRRESSNIRWIDSALIHKAAWP
jgi:hypothetical protein